VTLRALESACTSLPGTESDRRESYRKPTFRQPNPTPLPAQTVWMVSSWVVEDFRHDSQDSGQSETGAVLACSASDLALFLPHLLNVGLPWDLRPASHFHTSDKAHRFGDRGRRSRSVLLEGTALYAAVHA